MTSVKRRISVNLPWNPDFVDTFLSRARLADEIGIDTISVLEGYGHDAFTGMALARPRDLERAIASSIVNVFSRTPATLAQSFGTVDQLSGGRVVVGLGASAPGAIERFHGVKFERPFARIREAVELIRLYWSRERFSYDGPTIKVERALVSGMIPAQPTRADPPRHAQSNLRPHDRRNRRRLDADLDPQRSRAGIRSRRSSNGRSIRRTPGRCRRGPVARLRHRRPRPVQASRDRSRLRPGPGLLRGAATAPATSTSSSARASPGRGRRHARGVASRTESAPQPRSPWRSRPEILHARLVGRLRRLPR